MSDFFSGLLRRVAGEGEPERQSAPSASEPAVQTVTLPLNIAPNDPLLPLFQSARGVVDIANLEMDSEALRSMKGAGVSLAVPLVSQGELIGLLNLGPRLSEQEYSADDRALLSNLATQAAPALRVAQLVRKQKEEARALERIEHELQIARLIQQTLLPKQLPKIKGWKVGAYYRPALEVGGDFYDFFDLPDGKLGILVADVTDKGVPAAIVMATTRSMLRAAAERSNSPGKVLESANEQLCSDIPENMFVTCLYAVLNHSDGVLCFANAGHDLPYVQGGGHVKELYATGMPLGLMPGMKYEEKQTQIQPGDTILFHSDGLAEAHNPQREMFGFPRMKDLMSRHHGGTDVIDYLIDELVRFTGSDWEQEDDVTLVALERSGEGALSAPPASTEGLSAVTRFELPSERGIEKQAIRVIGDAVANYGLPSDQLERLKTAVGEATMNAAEHGNQYQADRNVLIEIGTRDQSIVVRIRDHGEGGNFPEPESPDIEAKLKGEQSPRGWGLFLIEKMVDEVNVFNDSISHTIELVVYLEGEDDGDE